MHCSEQGERSLAYLTGQLSQDQVADFQRHLDQCAACRARHADEAELLAAFDLPTDGLAGESLVSAVMADIAALPGRASQPRVVQLHPWAARAWVPVLAAAALALWVWSGQSAGHPGGHPGVEWGALTAAQLAGAQASLAAWTADWSALATAIAESAASTYRAGLGLTALRCPGFDACVEVAAATLLLACVGLIAGFRRTSARSL
ncbi:MAG: zf-HC2 domain-containing protein [Deltaproteobacteria bacterium]|nr:zf-HC2 domain-containing protein [Deltaproteobacteria bacterium]